MDRASGVLLPLFSLYSRHGIGTLGLPAYDFAAFLQKSGQKYWQMLPIGPTDWGNSPYQSFSSFAGNPYFIDPDTLAYEGYLTQQEVDETDFGSDPVRIDYEKLSRNRLPLLRRAYMRLSDERRKEVADYPEKQRNGLPDYALYMALRREAGDRPWNEWDKPLRRRDPAALEAARARLSDEIGFHCFLQMLFQMQWDRLRVYLDELNLKVIGDLPIYVPYDSADVWANQELFLLDRDLRPEAVSGVPPDYFSAEGQLWGSPLYDWDKMKRDNFAWWKQRMAAQTKWFDAVRIDHFRALASFWRVPANETTAKNGEWVKGPGIVFIRAMREALPKTQFIAEDLGLLTDDVRALLAESELPGMEVLEFAFTRGANSAYLPHNHKKNAVVYVGTHDNMTAAQFLNEMPEEAEYCGEYLGEKSVAALLRAGMMSVSDLFVSSMPDWLGLGAQARINTPSTVGANWQWRMRLGDLNDELAARIRRMTETYSRI